MLAVFRPPDSAVTQLWRHQSHDTLFG